MSFLISVINDHTNRRMSEFEKQLSVYICEINDTNVLNHDDVNRTKHFLCNGVQEVLRLLQLEPGNVLIDLGCGTYFFFFCKQNTVTSDHTNTF